MNKGKKIIMSIILIIILFFFLKWINFMEGIKILKDVNLFLLLLGFLIIYVTVILRTIRFHVISKSSGINVSFKKNLLIHGIANFFGVITPLKMGEGGKIFFFKKKSIEDMFYFLIEKMSDFCILMFLGFLGLFILKNYMIQYITIIIIIIIGILVLLKIDKIINFVLRKNILKPHWFKSMLKNISIKKYFFLIFITLLIWLNVIFADYILALSMGIKISYFLLLQLTAVSIIIGLISGLPGGAGAQEISLTLFLITYVNINKELAGMYSLYARIVFIAAYTIFGAISYYILKRNKLTLKKKPQEI